MLNSIQHYISRRGFYTNLMELKWNCNYWDILLYWSERSACASGWRAPALVENVVASINTIIFLSLSPPLSPPLLFLPEGVDLGIFRSKFSPFQTILIFQFLFCFRKILGKFRR